MKYIPHDYQTFAENHILSHPECALFLSMGFGKTIITLSAIEKLMYQTFEVRKVLVIAPLRVARNTWPAEIRKWDHVTAMQETVAKIVEEEKILNARIDALVDAKRNVREVIDLVENVNLRLILEKRHLLFQQWEEIAIDLGISSRWAKDRHKEALKAVDRILEEHPEFLGD